MDKNKRTTIIVLVAGMVLMAVAGGAFYRAATLSNWWQAKSVGDIPVPRGFARVSVADSSYASYLRALPLKERGAKLHLYNGVEAKHQVLAAAVVDQPLLNKYEQCADVAIRLWAEYLWQNGRYDEIRFTDVHDSVLQYAVDSTRLDSLRHDFEEYLKEVFAWCNTLSMEKETTPRDFVEVEAGDILVHPPLEGEDYGHAIVVVDVAKNAKGKVAIMCLEGNTPAREKHIVRNMRLWRNPWFVIDSNDSEIRFIKSRFHRGQLRHY